MSGPQFIRFQSFSRKSNKGGQSVSQVIDEVERVPEFCQHVDEPKPPVLIYGCSARDVSKRHDEMVAGGSTQVTLKNGKRATRGIRQDTHTLLGAVASHPYTTRMIEVLPSAREEYLDWRTKTIEWLKEKYGDRLISVLEHTDETHPHIHCYILPLGDPTCSARALNPAWSDKLSVEAQAKQEGLPLREAVKKGNTAYKVAASKLQDEYWEKVGKPCGLTRLGPKRQRLSRKQWQSQKAQANLYAEADRQLNAVDVREKNLDQAKADFREAAKAEAREIAQQGEDAKRATRDAEAIRDRALEEAQEAVEKREAEDRRAALANDKALEQEALVQNLKAEQEQVSKFLRNTQDELKAAKSELAPALSELDTVTSAVKAERSALENLRVQVKQTISDAKSAAQEQAAEIIASAKARASKITQNAIEEGRRAVQIIAEGWPEYAAADENYKQLMNQLIGLREAVTQTFGQLLIKFGATDERIDLGERDKNGDPPPVHDLVMERGKRSAKRKNELLMGNNNTPGGPR